MPGTVIRAIRDAESRNPVFLIDEIDKMGADFRGDPASAMLEVLDPEQHSTFRDHYLDLPFDLSKVLFICTANTLDTIPAPLLDRMDVIQLSGYTHDEKLGIARRYLVPKQLEAHGLTKSQLTIPDRVLRLVVERVHARGRRARPRAPDRRALPEGGDADRDRHGGEGARRRGEGARVARAAALLLARSGSAPPTRASRPGSPTPPSAATSSSSRRRRTSGAAGCTSPASSAR